MDNKYLKVKEGSIFEKIKSFFRNLFRKNEIIQEPEQEDVSTKKEEIKKSFADEIKIKEDEEKLATLKLQRDYEAGILREEDMTPEQVSSVESLYKEQISKLRNDYNGYKQKIIDIRKKLATNS